MSRSARRRVAGASLAALVAGVAASMVSKGVAAAPPEFPLVGHVAMSSHLTSSPAAAGPNDGSKTIPESALLLDVPGRRGYQLVGYMGPGGKQYTEVSVLDLDRLSVLRHADLPGVMPAWSEDVQQNPVQNYVAALKPGRDAPRLFFVASLDAGSDYKPYEVISVDLKSMSVNAHAVPPDLAASCVQGVLHNLACGVLGLAYDGRTDLVYALANETVVDPGLNVGSHYVMTMATMHAGDLSIVNRTTLPSVCDGVPSAFYTSRQDGTPLFLSTDRTHVWTACDTQSNNGAGGTVAAVDIPTDSATGVPNGKAVNVYPSVPYVQDVYAFPAQDRLYFLDQVSGDHNLVVFDARHTSYVGLVSLDKLHQTPTGTAHEPQIGAGVDPATGRYYFVGFWGIDLVDAARTDYSGIPQATQEPTDGRWRYGARDVVVDPVTRNVFVLYGGMQDPAAAQVLDTAYTVYQDNVPVSQDTPIASLDVNTDDVPPSQDTVQIYSGHAQGFGVRAFAFNPGDIGGNFSSLSSSGLQTSAFGNQREVLVGAAKSLDLSANAAEAVGNTVQIDDRTRGSYPQSVPAPPGAPQSSATPTPFPVNYPYQPVPCDDTTGKANSPARDDRVGSVNLTCDLASHVVSVTSTVGPTAEASAQSAGQLPIPEVGSITFSSKVSLENSYATAHGGKVPVVKSVATATLRHISLASNITIDSLVISATSYAGGRSKTAGTVVSRQINGVTAGTSHCDQCELSDTIKQINAALQQDYPGQAEVFIPLAQQDGANGTPHGYYSAVLKDTYAYLNDTVLNEDIRPELIGLEMIRNNDSLFLGEQARLITELGGVEVESRYGISKIVQDLGTPGDQGSATGTTTTVVPPMSSDQGGTLSTPPGSVHHPKPGHVRNPILQFFEQALQGLAAMLDVHQLPLMATVWTLFMLPGFLATRRRRLERFGL